MHVLIIADRRVGKTTMIRRLSAGVNRPVFGFFTQKETALADEENGDPIYIYEPGVPRTQTEENLVGYCKNCRFKAFPEVFERFAPKLKNPPAGSLIVMDEIGFMESDSEAFRNAVMALLDGDNPVIAAVKPNDFPFLNTVRAHPNCRTFLLTPENREQVYEEARAFMQEQGF